MPALFRRSVKVTVAGRPVDFVEDNPKFFETLGNAIEITDARITFDVQKNLGKEPNKCEIKIYNLAPHTRSELETKKPQRVTLQAGYAGEYRLLFDGDLSKAFSERDGRDIITTVRVSDGLRAYQHARMSKSYKPPIRVDRVLADAAKSMGLRLPPEVERSPELKHALAAGISLHGPTRDILTRLLAPYGFGWSVQNGHLVILRDEDARVGQEYLIDREAGLIGSPQRTTPEDSKKRPEIKFDVALFPELNPGNQVHVVGKYLDARAKLTDVQHIGNNKVDEYMTSCTGRPL